MALPLYASRLILPRSALLKIPQRSSSGFIVLIPELGEDDSQPKLKNQRDIEFTNLTTEKCITRLSKECMYFEEKVDELSSLLETYDGVDLFKKVLEPLESMSLGLEITWSIAKILSIGDVTIMPAEKYRSLHSRASIAIAKRYISRPIFNACKDLLSNSDGNLTDEQRRMLRHYVLEGKLNGLELNPKTLRKLTFSSNMTIHKRAEFDLRLKETVRTSSPKFEDYNKVKDLPDDLIKAMAKDPQKPTEPPWTLTLDTYLVDSFLEHCHDRNTRYKVWNAEVTKGSLRNERLLQTSVHLEEIRGKEQLKAETLGYASYMDLSLETKMAGSLENIYDTFDVLVDAARPAQEREIKELAEFARTRGQKDALNLWDIPYWSRRYKTDVYQTNTDELRSYLPLEKVLAGLFGLVEKLYNLKIVQGSNVGWDPSVQYFDVFDLTRSTTEPAGSFYFDPYRRDQGAVKFESREDRGWMMPIRAKSKKANTTPLTALIFNFRPPTSEMPCLVSFNAVNTLFQQFGKMLCHILSDVDYNSLAGTGNVEWDAAMVSDYFMANWLQEPSVLQQISGHYETGEPLPLNVIENLKKHRQHLAGYNLCAELYLCHFDLEMYSGSKFWMDIMKQLWSKYYVIPQHPENSHVCSWSAVFTENWGAAYYSHLWSRMLAADLFSAFDEISMDNEEEVKELAQRYRETFLAFGGTYPAGEVFRRFRGRDPCPQPLLSSLGLIEPVSDLEGVSRLGQR